MAGLTKAQREAKAKLAAAKTEVKPEVQMFDHIITQEDMDMNPCLIGEVEVGDVIGIPLEGATPEQITELIESGVIKTRATDPVEPETPEIGQPKPQKEDVVAEPANTQLYYNKKPVLNVSNKLVNGKLYKEVHMIDATYLLTEEEFNKQVTK